MGLGGDDDKMENGGGAGSGAGAAGGGGGGGGGGGFFESFKVGQHPLVYWNAPSVSHSACATTAETFRMLMFTPRPLLAGILGIHT